ncbi:hypothetical protein JOM56_003098, partial [Amanita muscaria]
AYYIAFGPCAPVNKPGDSLKIFASIMALIGAAGILSIALGQFGSFPAIPLFLLQWQEAENARAQEMK